MRLLLGTIFLLFNIGFKLLSAYLILLFIDNFSVEETFKSVLCVAGIITILELNFKTWIKVKVE